MAITYPKIKQKPARQYPSNNDVRGIRIRINQVNPDPSLGEFALTKDIAVHIGTIPKGSFVLPGVSKVETGFTATVTVDVGTVALPGAFIPTASIVPATPGNAVGNIVGVGQGLQLADTPVYIVAQVAVPAAGKAEFFLPFYTSRD